MSDRAEILKPPLVPYLRTLAESFHQGTRPRLAFHAAADEIERLRAENAELLGTILRMSEKTKLLAETTK